MRLFSVSLSLIAVLGSMLLMNTVARADDPALHLTLKDHVFTPKVLNVPTGKKVKLVIKNANGQPAEFESFSLHREKTIADGEEASIFIGPLKAGTYSFFDDLDVNKATGKVIAK